MEEVELIKQCQAGDRDSFEALIEQHYDTIYRIAYRWCGDQHNAQDITQLAAIKLARSIVKFDFESSFTSWLYRLTINCAKDFYKSPTQHNQREVDTPDWELAGTDDRSAERFYAHQILNHIGTIKQDLRDALILVFVSGLTHQQAASQLNVEESTISWRVHEARNILKSTFSSSALGDPVAVNEQRGMA